MGALVRRWNLMEELARRLQQLETQVGQQRAVIEHQQEQLMRQQTTIDAERAARTPVNPAQDIGSGNETGRNETGELRHGGWKDHAGLPSVGRDTADLVVGIHDGLRLPCTLHEGSLLDI